MVHITRKIKKNINISLIRRRKLFYLYIYNYFKKVNYAYMLLHTTENDRIMSLIIKRHDATNEQFRKSI